MAAERILKIDLPGLLKEKLPSGNHRYRVRVERRKAQRVRLRVEPGHPDFMEHYEAARRGIEMPMPEQLEASRDPKTLRGSINWLVAEYLGWFEAQVAAGQYSAATLKQRRSQFRHLEAVGEYALEIPQGELLQLRDSMSGTPGAADNFIKSIRAMYAWAVERQICEANPATGIGKLLKKHTGAKPWTIVDLQRYRKTHAPGTMAHLALTLFMFTACRISDVVHLGRDNEFDRAGVRGLGWQPRKKGSAFVEIPMLPPLYRATRSSNIAGASYLLTEKGVPFASPEAFRNRFRKWCDAAGLQELSSHGIRKAAGNLLAQNGCSQHEIMAIHGHTEAKTSEIYTRGVERWKLAGNAMRTLEDMEW